MKKHKTYTHAFRLLPTAQYVLAIAFASVPATLSSFHKQAHFLSPTFLPFILSVYFTSMASSSSSRKRQRLTESGNAFEEVVPPSVTTSSPLARNKLSYDVFINHRGEVKETLAKDVYKALSSSREIRVFFDKEELEAGDCIPIELQEAMKGALLHIAIFSERYAESAWCLAELSFMLKTQKKIIPVFYRVDPADLRWVGKGKGKYNRAFCEHEKNNRYTPEKLQEWKLALEKVSYFSGYIINNEDDWKRDLEKLQELVANEMKQPLHLSKPGLFGLEETVKDFQAKTKGDDSPQIVGIVGMGGSGKTTLAKAVYNSKFASIKSSFLYDVRDEASKNQLVRLQKKLLKDLGAGDPSFENENEGMDIIANRLRNVSMLVVVDDVDGQNQINALVPPKEILGAGSLIVVTTRGRDVLTSAGIFSSIYEMKGLDLSYARGLFCFHAFQSCDPPQELEDLVEKSLSTCQGLPLSLKVFGSQLFKRSREYWESQLNEFSRVLPLDIKKILRKSYDALDPEEQELFLDIACFLIGERKRLVIEVWEGLGQNGVYRLETLNDKCLVELDQENRIRMHDHLRDLGREIAKGESTYRIWLPGQINNSSPQAKEEMQIRGIMAATTSFWEKRYWPSLDWVCPSNYGPFADGFCSSHFGPFEDSRRHPRRHEPSSLALKFLVLKDKFFSREIGKLSKGLVWLRWFDFDHECLPSHLSLGNLRVLELYQVKRIKTLWKNNRNPPLQLRELIIQGDLSHSRVTFQSFPKSIGSLKLLKKLVIDCCWSWKESSFSSLPDEFCELESLEHLELKGFKMLLSLPSRFGNLRKLRHVTLQLLKSLTCLPVSFKQLTCLQYLDLSYCSSLNFTSDNLDILENITKLEYFDFQNCRELEALPNFTNQPLRKLYITKCDKLISLPTSFGNLSYLTTLHIGSCSSLECLPPSFVNLSSLTTLDIFNCSSLECLPHSFGNLSNLTTLDISCCSSLKCLPHSFGNLSNLTTLHITLCPRLESFPDTLGLLNLLEKLEMGPLGVKSLPDSFGQLANLRELSISDCRLRSGFASSFCSLKKLFLYSTLDPTISISEDCVSLETLTICDSSELMEIETLPKTLKRLEVKECPTLEKLPCFAYFTSLKDLVIDGPNKIEKIENLEQMASLEKLTVTNGGKLPRLAGLEQIQRRLRRVELSVDNNISALVPCIQTIKRSPSEIIIRGRVVDGAESMVTDYTFPHLTVLHSVANKDISRHWTLNCPKRCSSNWAIICVLFNCLYEKCELYLTGDLDIWRVSKGKWIWVGVFDSSNIEESSVTAYSLITGEENGLKIEKEIIAVGEESRVQEAFKKLMLTVTRPT